jgi:hypothetical protein
MASSLLGPVATTRVAGFCVTLQRRHRGGKIA